LRRIASGSARAEELLAQAEEADSFGQSIDRIRIDMDRIGGPSPQIGQKRWDQATLIAKEQIARWRRGEKADLEQPPVKPS
jgi:hypothetical protein